MSVTPSQPSTTSSALPVPVVSDISASQTQPAVSLAPVNGISAGTNGVSAGSAAAQAVPEPSVSTLPTSSAPSQQPLQPANPAKHLVPSTTASVGHTSTPQYHGLPVVSSHPSTVQGYPVQIGQPVYPPQHTQTGYAREAMQHSYQQQSSRPIIVDPPRKRSSIGLAVAMPPVNSTAPGFPSPTKNYPAAFPKFSDDLSRNTLAIKQSVPEAVRQAVRDNWEKCLLGSEFHQAFVLNASMHHSTPSVQNRAVHDFGANLVSNCKAELIEHFTNRDIDDVADLILARASNAFLDKALEMRLATIDAKPLLNALARAERLGYDSQDLVEVFPGEHVIPNSRGSQLPASGPGANVAGPAAVSNGNRAAHPGELQCLKCFRTFIKPSYFDYHLSRSICAKLPPTADGFRYSCGKCGQGFTHPGGLTYHNAHQVCESGANASASEPQQRNLPATPVSARGNASPAYPPSSQIAKSGAASVLPANRPGQVPATGSSPAHDPYGHLSAEQMASLNEELLQAEEQYSGRFREAEAIPDLEQRRTRLESLRNTFGTKQSMIRKKYGVRLRERRTRAEIQAERERMGRKSLINDADNNSPAPTQPPSATAWAAANRVSSVDLTGDSTPSLKRRRVDEGNDYRSPYPQTGGETTKVSEMAGGLTASSANAAHHDPTLPPPNPSNAATPSHTYQQSGARVEIHLPSKPTSSVAASSSGPADDTGSREPDSMTPGAMELDRQIQEETQNQDIQADAEEEEEENEEENEVISIEDDSDDNIEDIPARLPDNVRQSLTSPQPGMRS